MERAVLAGLLGFALGIAAYDLLLPSVLLPLWTLGAAGFLALLWLKKRQETARLVVCALVFGVALGACRTLLSSIGLPSSLEAKMGERVVLEGVIVADPDIRETTARLVAEVTVPEGTTKLLVVTGRYPSFSYGEEVRIEGKLETPEPFSTDAGRVFAYDRFLAKDGVFGIIEYASVEHIAAREGWRLIPGFLYDLKNAGVAALSAALPEPHASLASGLILGGKQGLGESLLDDFIVAGLVHIVVLSGYNVMIVADFVMRLFGFLMRRRAALVGAAAIALFVIAAGAGPASIRAGIMAVIALYARATGRAYEAFRALLLAAFLMLLMSPLTLLYDPGFQLSFVATLGLIFGAPQVERLLSFLKSAFLRGIAASTIAAQVAVLPLLLYQNGLLSLVALPANLLVLPFVPLAMLFSALALFVAALLPSFGPLFALPAYMLLSGIIFTVETAASIPLAAVSVPSFPFVLVVVAYGTLGYLLYMTKSLAQETASQPHAS